MPNTRKALISKQAMKFYDCRDACRANDFKAFEGLEIAAIFSYLCNLGFRRVDPIEKVSNFWTGTYRFNVANGWNQTNFMISVDTKKLKSRNSAYAVLGTV